MDMLEEAKRVITTIEASMSMELAGARATVAIACALIAIAELLEKINKREEEKDKPWEKGLGL